MKGFKRGSKESKSKKDESKKDKSTKQLGIQIWDESELLKRLGR